MTAIALSAINHRIKSISIPSIHWKGILTVSFISAFILLVFYVMLINEMTKGAYLIKTYDKQVSTLSDQNQTLQMSLAKTDELSRVIERAQAAGFEKTSGIKYVHMFENSLAQAR